MGKKFHYKHGLPFSTKLSENITSLMTRIKNGKASMILIDGGVGEGKTTLGIHISDFALGKYAPSGTLKWENSNKETNLKTQYAMGGEEFQEKLQICYETKQVTIIYDEAGDFNRRGALTQFNQRLNRIFQTYRAFKILVILILPNFNILDQSLFDLKIPRLLLNCYGRNNLQGNIRAYSLYRMHYVKHKMQKLVVKDYAYTQVTPNFRGHYLDLVPSKSKELDKICTSGKLDIVSENILNSRGLISIKAMAIKLSRTDRWVRSKLKKLKITHQTNHKKKNYYDSSALDFLRNEMGAR